MTCLNIFAHLQRFTMTLLVLAISLVGCSANNSLPFKTLLQGEGNGVANHDLDPHLFVLKDISIAGVLSGYLESNANWVKGVDFQKNMVLVVSLGFRASNGYKVTVERITRDGQDINVYMREHKPGPNQQTEAFLTNPYHVVLLQLERKEGEQIKFHLVQESSASGK